MMTHTSIRQLAAIGIAAVVIVATAAPARAQSFISPLIGFNFGGDAACPEITNCEDKRIGYGGALGHMGNVFGVEEEFGYTKDFFGSIPEVSSSVMTVMTNVMLIPDLGPVRPYALVGLGGIRSHSAATTSNAADDNWDLGWDVGGGLMILFAPHVGVRGDVRYFHAFSDLSFLGLVLSDKKLDFGRASGALVLTF